MKVFSHQVQSLEEIIARGRAYFGGQWHHPSVQRLKPRFATLIVGGTGVGKTTLTSIAADALNASLLRVSSPGWIPAGAHNRGVTETVVMIAGHVGRNARTMLVLDEIDKICPHGSAGAGQDAWLAYARGEVMDLADGRWPEGLRTPTDDGDEGPLMKSILIERLTTKLRNTVFIVGIGTFQEFWDSAGSRRTMGFSWDEDQNTKEMSASVLVQHLPRELANRFNSKLIKLPDLRPSDYQAIAREAADSLPEHIRVPFFEIATRMIPGAIDAKKGVRFLEEAMVDTLIGLSSEISPIAGATSAEPKPAEPLSQSFVL